MVEIRRAQSGDEAILARTLPNDRSLYCQNADVDGRSSPDGKEREYGSNP